MSAALVVNCKTPSDKCCHKDNKGSGESHTWFNFTAQEVQGRKQHSATPSQDIVISHRTARVLMFKTDWKQESYCICQILAGNT
jgi:hypothetical protein